MLKLILGRAKSGKTAAVMDAIRLRTEQQLGNTVLVVPENYSHEAERELLQVCGDRLCLYAEVLPFSRIASQVESELGFGGRAALDRGGRLLCLVRAADAVGTQLSAFGSVRRQAAVQQQLLAAIDECKTCCIRPEDLAACADDQPPFLRDKLTDLSLIFSAYEAIAAQSGLDPMDRLSLLADRLPGSRYAAGCYFIDGFTSFTAQEYRVIETLLRCGAEVTVCLTADGLEESHEIFEPGRRAALKLQRLADAAGCRASVEILRDEPGVSPTEVLERELFSFGGETRDAEGKIRILCAQDIPGECEAAAAKCLSLVRETGCRWRDVAVAVRDYETYRAAIESIFPHYGIPVFSARKSDLTEKPLIALLLSAYAVVTGGWDYEDLFACLKTGLAGLSTAECDQLENYAFLWTLQGSAWTADEDWTLHPDGYNAEYNDEVWSRLRRINALRRRAAAPLKVLEERSRAAKTAKEQAEALTAYFDALKLPEILAKRAEELKALGQVQTAAEYAQLWELIAGAAEQCAAILGDTEMNAEEFQQLFCLVLSAYPVGSIPLSLDRVSAGGMDRMRRRHIRHLIVLGCDSDSLPKSEGEPGIFSDDDRESLRASGLELGETAGERMDLEYAMLYNCLTLPEDTLTLSWCVTGAEGARRMPSFVVNRTAELFGLPTAVPSPDACRASAPLPAFELAASAVGGTGSALRASALDYFKNKGKESELQRLYDAAHLKRGRLSPDAVRSLYGEAPRLSASRIDKLSSCQFSDFLQYGLKAKPRKPADFAPPEMGTFFHDILENVARDIASEGGFDRVTKEQVDALCDRYVERYIHEELRDFAQKSPRFVFLFRRLTATVRSVVSDMVAELAKSDFRPLDFELDFGKSSEFPPVSIGDSNARLVLTGIADRVDGFVKEGKLYLRVVDYKTGKKAFDYGDIYNGIGLQMLLYLFALQKNGGQHYHFREIVPAGVLYVPARDPVLSADTALSEDEVRKKKASGKKRSGLLLDDAEILAAMEHGETPEFLPVKLKDGVYGGSSLATLERFGALEKHIRETLEDMAKELHGGAVEAEPWYQSETKNACLYCDYKSACHFNEQNDCIRYLSKMDADEFWTKLEEKEEGL